MSKRSLPGFTGAYQDGVTFGYGLGHGYRWHLPVLMRFNAPDSLSPFAAGGINPYAYCAGDPINHSDPTGHMFNPGEVVEAVDEVAHTSRSTAQATDALSAHPSEPDGAADRRGTSAAALLAVMRRSENVVAPRYRISLAQGKPLPEYSSMTLTHYAVDGGEDIPFETPLTLHPGGTVTTPPIQVMSVRPYTGVMEEANVDLRFRLEAHLGSGGEMRLRVRTYAQDVARWHRGEHYNGPSDWQAGISAGYPQDMDGHDVRFMQPQTTVFGVTGVGAVGPRPIDAPIRFELNGAPPTIPFTIMGASCRVQIIRL